MTRLPFNAGAVQGASDGDSDDAGSDDRPWSVTQLSARIKRTLESGLPATVRVAGEIGNLSDRNHWYFTLKDDDSVVGCVAWASDARRFGFVPRDGDAVVATGSVSYYGPQGRTQLYVRRLEPAGEGALAARFRALCDELRAKGYFDDARKRALPAFPRRIAVVTSASGAAQHDVIETARTRCPAVGLLLVDARVQGEGSAESVARAIRWIDRRHKALGVDAVIVTRGGGSLEDLWAFNERIVADAVLHCSLPVVAAIGHESDTTVAELVADCRASTPTQAAMRLVPDARDLARQVDHVASRMRSLLHQRVQRERDHVERLAAHAIFRRPRAPLEMLAERLADLERRLETAAGTRLREGTQGLGALAVRLELAARRSLPLRRERVAQLADRLARADRHVLQSARQRLDGLAHRFDAVDPRLVLRRGFSYTTSKTGVVRSVSEVRAGDRLVTHLADGAIGSVVEADGEREQLDLFDAPR